MNCDTAVDTARSRWAMFGGETRRVEDHEGRDRNQHDRRGRQRGRIAPGEFADAIGPGVGPRLDRTIFQVALHILGECSGRRVATLGLAVHGAQDDVVQVA
jgi:hypothetical protein